MYANIYNLSEIELENPLTQIQHTHYSILPCGCNEVVGASIVVELLGGSVVVELHIGMSQNPHRTLASVV